MTVSPINALLELSPLPMLAVDSAGIILQANNLATTILGRAQENIAGQQLTLLLPGSIQLVHSTAPQTSSPYELSIVRLDGRELYLELAHKPFNIAGELGSIVTITDVTVRKEVQLALQNVHALDQLGEAGKGMAHAHDNHVQLGKPQFRELKYNEEEVNLHGAFHSAPIGMMLVDLDWQITRVNRSICDMLGYSSDELLTKTFQDITHPDDISTDLDLVRQMIAGDINDYRLEKRYFHKNGHVIWMLLSVSLLKDSNNIPVHFIFHILDITDYKKIQQQISEYAYQDALTNLPNRRLLQDRLNHALEHAKRYKRRMGIMFLDIDHFKAVNDTYGHAFGDELIKHVAGKLSECVRSSDTVCRLGGDEFVIVISEINTEQDVSVVAEKILKCVSQPISIEGHIAQVTMSIGVVLYDTNIEDSAESLMKKADQSLYEMKKEGRNGFRIFNA